MAIILSLETATTNCSVCVSKDGEVRYMKEENAPNYSHAEQLHVFIENCLHGAGLRLSDLDAVAVSKGPGSYTGLRIGVSAAKGLCYALDLPLISIHTLQHLALGAMAQVTDVVIPVLDARRMEVYAEVYDKDLQCLEATRAQVVNEASFSHYQGRAVHFVGSGAAKLEKLLRRPGFTFNPKAVPSAKDMVSLSHAKFARSQFEDVAYFEPFYLKDFIAHTSKKNPLDGKKRS